MRKTIWKYTLEITDRQAVTVPRGAVPLTVQTQSDIPQLWVEVDPDETDTEKLIIHTHGTGHTLLPGTTSRPHHGSGDYLSTYQLLEGNLVFHVYWLRMWPHE